MDGYIDQFAEDLKLCVYAGVPNIEKCARIFKEYREEISPGVHIHLGIIGASHFFSLRMDGEHFGFTELFACMKPPAFEGDALLTPLRLLTIPGHSALKLAFPPFRYRFYGSVCDATPEKLVQVEKFKEDLRRGKSEYDPVRVSLEYDFSSSADEAGSNPFPPETLVSFRFFPKCTHVMLETVHMYPNEEKIVFTSSDLTRV